MSNQMRYEVHRYFDFHIAPKSYLCHDQSKKFHTSSFIKMYSRLSLHILKMGKTYISNLQEFGLDEVELKMSCNKASNRSQSGLICPFAIAYFCYHSGMYYFKSDIFAAKPMNEIVSW